MSVRSVLKTLATVLPDFLFSSDGSLAVVSGLTTTGIILSAGIAVDMAEVNATRTALTAAADAAVLQAAATGSDDLDTLEEKASKSLDENYNAARYGEIIDQDITLSGDDTTLTVTARYPTSFLNLIGIDHFNVPATATATRGGINIEVALVLDTTSSMSSSSMAALKVAAKSLADSVINGSQTTYTTRVAVIPYSYAVNLGTRASDARGPITSGTCTNPGCDYYSFTRSDKASASYSIQSCVTERTGDYAYTDDPISTSYVGRQYAPNSGWCLSTNELLPLTSDIEAVEDRIDELVQGGATAGQVGVAWGWYVLSPNFGLWTGDETSAAYGAENTSKIAVIMTDGAFNVAYCNGVMSSDYAQGSQAINCKATNGSPSTQAQTLCTAMKAAGITIYTVGYDISSSSSAKSLLSNCATDSDKYYLSSTTSELEEAFESIAQDVVSLRLSK